MLWLVDGNFRRREEISQEQLDQLAREDPEIRIRTPRRMLGMGCRLVAVGTSTRQDGRIFAEYQTWLSARHRWDQAVRGQDTRASALVWSIVSKSGPIADQFTCRSALRQNPSGLDPCSAEVLSMWPVAGAGRLSMGLLPCSEDIPDPWEIDMVASAWALHDFDPRSVATLREAAARRKLLPPIRSRAVAILSHPFAREYAELMDHCPLDGQRVGEPTYVQLIDRYATCAFDAVAHFSEPQAQFAALHAWLMHWIGDVGVVDLKSSLISGVLDCDPLSIIAAEVLARLGWTATLLSEEVESGENGNNNTTISHVLLQVSLPESNKDTPGQVWLYDPAGGSAVGLPEGNMTDDTPRSKIVEMRLWSPHEAFKEESLLRGFVDK
jgi:hypothetical protein